MRKSALSGFLKLIFVLAIIFALFAWLLSSIEFDIPKTSDFVSIENENKLGDLVVDEMILKEGQNNKITDPQLDSAISEITDRLIKNVGETKYNYRFVILDDPQVNAFTVPGGNIFILKGLLEFADSPNEVAAVLAHEIGHAEKRHVVSKLIKELGTQVVLTVLSGGDPGTVITISRHLISTMYDRDMEREADRFSFELMEKSGIDPKSLAVFFKKLDGEGTTPDNVSFLNTHPSNEERIKECLSYQTGKSFKEIPFSSNWVKIKSNLQSIRKF